jgi:hypothetical protein
MSVAFAPVPLDKRLSDAVPPLLAGLLVVNDMPAVLVASLYRAVTAATEPSSKFSFQITSGSAPIPISPGYFFASVSLAGLQFVVVVVPPSTEMDAGGHGFVCAKQIAGSDSMNATESRDDVCSFIKYSGI